MLQLTRNLFIFFFLLFPFPSFSTGPSFLKSEIIPVYKTDKGILCYSRFTTNPMGAHKAMPIEYSIVLLSDKKTNILYTETLTPKHGASSVIKKAKRLDKIIFQNAEKNGTN